MRQASASHPGGGGLASGSQPTRPLLARPTLFEHGILPIPVNMPTVEKLCDMVRMCGGGATATGQAQGSGRLTIASWHKIAKETFKMDTVGFRPLTQMPCSLGKLVRTTHTCCAMSTIPRGTLPTFPPCQSDSCNFFCQTTAFQLFGFPRRVTHSLCSRFSSTARTQIHCKDQETARRRSPTSTQLSLQSIYFCSPPTSQCAAPCGHIFAIFRLTQLFHASSRSM
jgi:hypothetical protein